MSVLVKVAGKWQEIGVDGGSSMKWAKVSGGTVTTVNNPDGSVDEVHTFTADGALTVAEAGYARVLLVSGGGGAWSNADYGDGGSVREGIFSLPAGTHPVVVGAGGLGGDPAGNVNHLRGKASTLGSLSSTGSTPARGAGVQNDWAAGVKWEGVTSDITGTSIEYGQGGGATGAPTTPTANRGMGGTITGNSPGGTGVVVVRVQKSAPTAIGGQAVISGGTVTRAVGTDGRTYDFHKFTTSGAGPTVTTSGKARVLVVGGAGGNSGDGGGGAGGYIDTVMELVAGKDYPVTIGPAGANNGQSTVGGDGGDSYFASLRALGGGGGANSVSAGRNGGSGGGGSRASAGLNGKAILTYGRQGYDGAEGWVGGPAGGAGGGGSASVGQPRADGQPTDGRGGDGTMWLDGLYYASAGMHGTGTVTAGQTPNGQEPRANSGMSGGGYLTGSAAGVVIIAIEVAP